MKKQTHHTNHSMGVYLRSQVPQPQMDDVESYNYSQNVAPQNQQHNTLDYIQQTQHHFRQPTLLSSIQQYQTISNDSQPQHQLQYASIPGSNLTSLHQANNSRFVTTPQTQVLSHNMQEQDDEESNPLLEVEVRDIVNNYLNDSLQSGDEIRSANEQQIEMGEVEVQDQSEHQSFQRTDELQKALFADADEGKTAVHRMESEAIQEEGTVQFADQYCIQNKSSVSSQQQFVHMQQTTISQPNEAPTFNINTYTLDASLNTRSKSDQKHDSSIISQQEAVKISKQKLSNKQQKFNQLEILLKRERQMESTRDFQNQKKVEPRLQFPKMPKMQINSEDQKIRSTAYSQSTKNKHAKEIAFSQRGAVVMQSLDHNAQQYQRDQSDNKIERRMAASQNENAQIIQNGFQSYHQQQQVPQQIQQAISSRYSKKAALETIRSHIESPQKYGNEEMTDIIERLRQFSPIKVKQDLADKYKANQSDLRQVIKGMEEEKEDQLKNEEYYKDRIRLIQVQNIKNLQQKEHLMNQAMEMTRFFRFLNRCRKRMKRTLQLSKMSTADELDQRKTRRNHRNRSSIKGKGMKEYGRIMSQNERTITNDQTTIMQTINDTASLSQSRCKSGDARLDTLRSPNSTSKVNFNVNDDGMVDLVKSANDIKLQFRVLLDRIKLQTQINQKQLQDQKQVRHKEREQQKEFAQSIRQSDKQVLMNLRNQAQQDEQRLNLNWELQVRRLQNEMHSQKEENSKLKYDLQHYSKQNFELEQSLEKSESDLNKLRMQSGAQARQIKTLLEHNPSSSDFSNDITSNAQEGKEMPQKLSELTNYIRNLETENAQQKQVIEAMDLRAQKFVKVDDLQKDLDKLLENNQKDKKSFQAAEQTLNGRIEYLEADIQRLIGKNKDDHEFFKMENLRKDQAIENMQQTFIMVLQRAVQKIAFVLDNKSSMTMPKVEGCLEEIMRNLLVEIDSIKTQFMGEEESSRPIISPRDNRGLINEIYNPAPRLKPKTKTSKSQPRKDQKSKRENQTFIYTNPQPDSSQPLRKDSPKRAQAQTFQPLRKESPRRKDVENQDNNVLRHTYAEQNKGGQTFSHKSAIPQEFTAAAQSNHQFTRSLAPNGDQNFNRTQSFGSATANDIGWLRIASFTNTISEPQFEREQSNNQTELQNYLNNY